MQYYHCHLQQRQGGRSDGPELDIYYGNGYGNGYSPDYEQVRDDGYGCVDYSDMHSTGCSNIKKKESLVLDNDATSKYNSDGHVLYFVSNILLILAIVYFTLYYF